MRRTLLALTVASVMTASALLWAAQPYAGCRYVVAQAETVAVAGLQCLWHDAPPLVGSTHNPDTGRWQYAED